MLISYCCRDYYSYIIIVLLVLFPHQYSVVFYLCICFFSTGATFVENCKLQGVITDKKLNKVIGLKTSNGDVKCDYFINAAGQVTPDYKS